MATLTLPAGISILAYAGPTALPLTGASKPSWFTDANFNGIYKQSANRLSYISCLPKALYPAFSSLDVVTPGQVLSGYVFNLKQPITVDASLFALLLDNTGVTLPKLATPTLTASSTSNTTIQVVVNPVANAVKYMLYQASLAAGPYQPSAAQTGNTFNLYGVSPGQTFWFKAQVLADGVTYANSDVSGVTSATTPAPTKLAAPANGKAVANAVGQLLVTADVVSNAAGFQLYARITGGGAFAKLGGVLVTPSYTHTGLSAGMVWDYQWQTTGNNTTTADSDLSAVFSGAVYSTANFSVAVNAQRSAALTLPTGDAPADYEFQFRPAPTISATRQLDLSLTLAPGETFADYEYQLRTS